MMKMADETRAYRIKRDGFFKEMRKRYVLYLMALPGMLHMFLFCYLPLAGLMLAFKDFKYNKGLFGSEWVKPFYYNFIYLFTSEGIFRATKNTILLNVMFIVAGTVTAIALAIALNEITQKMLKKTIQSITFLPYFMSWIIVSVFVYGIFSTQTGAMNNLLTIIGFDKVSWYQSPEYWPVILLLVYIWKGVGYNSIIYLATLSGVDPSYYEAAKLDGATRVQMIRYISIPMLIPTAIILFLLAVGRIMNADFGMFYGIIGDNSLLYKTTDVIDTFIYRNLRKVGDIGMASAANFYQSVIGFMFVLTFNRLAKTYDKDASLF